MDVADDVERLGVVESPTGKTGDQLGVLLGPKRGAPGGPEIGEQLGGCRTVGAEQFEQESLQVRRDLDVHARRERRDDRFGGHRAGVNQPGEDVVGVRRDEQPFDREPHSSSTVPGEHVAEVAGGDTERGGGVAPVELLSSPHVVDDLGHHAGPVDGVDRREADATAERLVGKHCLHEVLTVVERAVDGDGVDVRRVEGGHLATLDLTRSALRKEDDDVDPVAVANGVHGCRPGVARCRPHDGHSLISPFELMVEQAAEQLQGDIFERQGRTVEELEQVMPGLEFNQRAHLGVREGRIGVLDHRPEVVEADRVGNEGCHHGGGDRGVVTLGRRKLRPCGRQVQTTVGGEAAEQGVAEPDLG